MTRIWREMGAGCRDKHAKEVSIPPVGSGCAGNNSLPHIDQAAAAVTMPPNAEEWLISSVGSRSAFDFRCGCYQGGYSRLGISNDVYMNKH